MKNIKMMEMKKMKDKKEVSDRDKIIVELIKHVGYLSINILNYEIISKE